MNLWGCSHVILNVVVTLNSSGEVLEARLDRLVILLSISHDPLLISFFTDVKLVTIWISVHHASPGPSCDRVLEAWELSGLILMDQMKSASEILESHVWVQIRNDVLTHGGSHKHVFVVHARVTKHHVPMVLGVKVQ